MSSSAFLGKCKRVAVKYRAREELAILVLVEPRAFKIEERDAAQMRKCQRVYRKLRKRLSSGRVGLVIENVDGAVPDLEEVNVAGDDTVLPG